MILGCNVKYLQWSDVCVCVCMCVFLCVRVCFTPSICRAPGHLWKVSVQWDRWTNTSCCWCMEWEVLVRQGFGEQGEERGSWGSGSIGTEFCSVWIVSRGSIMRDGLSLQLKTSVHLCVTSQCIPTLR